MKGKFLSSLFLLVVLNLLVKPFYILGIDAEVQNRVGEEVYGNYYALLNFSFLLNILLDLGITNYNTRNIAQHPQLLAKHFYKILSLRFALFGLYATFTLLSGALMGYNSNEFYILSILLVNQFLVAIIQFSRSNFAGLHLFKTDALISVLDRSLLIIFVSILLWTNWVGDTFQIEWFIYAQTLAYGITAIVSVTALSKRIEQIKIGIKKTFSLVLLRQSLPYALLIFLMMMYNRIDAVMLERMLDDGDTQAGIYAQGFRILDAVNMFALLFAGLLLPIFARLIKKKEDISEMMYLAFRILVGISIVVSLVLFFHGSGLIKARYDSATWESVMSFSLLILSFVPVAITYVFGTLLTANGSLKQLNYMALFGLVLNIVLNAILIEDYKVIGAAGATLITQSITAVIQLILVYRILKVKFEIGIYLKLFTLAALVFGGLYAYFNSGLTIYPIMGTIISGLIGVILGFALGIFKISDIRQMKSK
ncbi:MAG: O-antigen/teichoic acid export membrane protein [Arenicella sp.]|jgi:O-antigen/teichoic acid export membrane protein